MLNIGLLLPLQIVHAAIAFANKNPVSINSLEGFIRQMIGWREFIRGVYIYKGTKERTTNFWKFNKNIPASFYEANTGIEPIDTSIKKLIHTAYNHHIERLMVLGNWALQRGYDPLETADWFRRVYLDGYEWVMSANVIGMALYADGGVMASKPYIASGRYIDRMSDHCRACRYDPALSTGEKACPFTTLYWDFLLRHEARLAANPRMGMQVRNLGRLDADARKAIRQQASALRGRLSGG